MNIEIIMNCTNCNLIAKAGSDDMYNENNNRVGTDYYICSACGACHSLFWPDDKMILSVTPPQFKNLDALYASDNFAKEINEFNINYQKCLHCNEKGTLIDYYNSSPVECPNCGENTFRFY